MNFKGNEIALGVICGLMGLALAGCGETKSSRAEIRGEVTLDGKPLEQGAIRFIPVQAGSGTATGGDIKAGKYRIPADRGAALGTNRVEVTALRATGKRVPNPMGKPGDTVEMFEGAVAARFDSASTLTKVVEPGSNTANFAVESK